MEAMIAVNLPITPALEIDAAQVIYDNARAVEALRLDAALARSNAFAMRSRASRRSRLAVGGAVAFAALGAAMLMRSRHKLVAW